jgi:hypothetical protein
LCTYLIGLCISGDFLLGIVVGYLRSSSIFDASVLHGTRSAHDLALTGDPLLRGHLATNDGRDDLSQDATRLRLRLDGVDLRPAALTAERAVLVERDARLAAGGPPLQTVSRDRDRATH